MIKFLALVGALGAGAALLHAQYTNPTPITLNDLARSTDQGVTMAKDAADTAGDVADKVTSTAEKGVHAAKSTANFITDTYDAGARMVDHVRTSMTAAPSPPAKPRAALVQTAPGPDASRMHARDRARDILPADMVLPPPAAASAD